jgi:uncharacterized protein
VLYVDSSALLKHYIRQPGTDALNTKLQQESLNHEIYISTIGYAEILATFARRVRGSPGTNAQTKLIQRKFQDEWSSAFNHIELSVNVMSYIPKLVQAYPLRGSDAIHLASALWLRDSSPQLAIGNVTFACSDRQLNRAASTEGLLVFDPESQP